MYPKHPPLSSENVDVNLNISCDKNIFTDVSFIAIVNIYIFFYEDILQI